MRNHLIANLTPQSPDTLSGNLAKAQRFFRKNLFKFFATETLRFLSNNSVVHNHLLLALPIRMKFRMNSINQSSKSKAN